MTPTEPVAPGAPAPAGFVPLCVPEVRGNEWRYVKECLDTNWLSSVGPFVDRFEREIAAFVGTRHAIATASGTAALHVALLAAGVEPDDEVIIPSLTFIAPANAIRYVRAWPVFLDVEPDYWQLDVAQFRSFVETRCRNVDGVFRNTRTGRRVRAVLPVHALGHPCDMDQLNEVANRFGLRVIEDATESLGSTYKGRPAGSLSDAGCLSFNGNKIMTTGGGGMVVTNDADLARRARHLATQAKADPVEYIHDEIGFNYRLTSLQAAVGCAQLERLPEFVEAKRRVAARYEAALRGVPGITTPRVAAWAKTNAWLYTVLVDQERYGEVSRNVIARLARNKIQARPLWQPIHMSPAHRQRACEPCPVAERLYRDGLSLPSSVGLTANEQDRVLEVMIRGPRG